MTSPIEYIEEICHNFNKFRKDMTRVDNTLLNHSDRILRLQISKDKLYASVNEITKINKSQERHIGALYKEDNEKAHQINMLKQTIEEMKERHHELSKKFHQHKNKGKPLSDFKYSDTFAGGIVY